MRSSDEGIAGWASVRAPGSLVFRVVAASSASAKALVERLEAMGVEAQTSLAASTRTERAPSASGPRNERGDREGHDEGGAGSRAPGTARSPASSGEGEEGGAAPGTARSPASSGEGEEGGAAPWTPGTARSADSSDEGDAGCAAPETSGVTALSGEGVDAVLVIAEDLDHLPEALGPDAQLVSLRPETPPFYRGRPVVPAHVPGALEAWLFVLADRARLARETAEARSRLSAVMDADENGLVVLDEADRVLLSNRAARALLAAHRVEPGERLPFALPSGACRRIITLDGRSVGIHIERLSWAGRPARLLTLGKVAGPESFEGRLAHADRLAAVGALAAGFAHEVNNPAQSVTADLSELVDQLRALERGLERAYQLVPEANRDELLALELERPLADAYDLLQECFDGLGRIASIVRDLKSFSKIQPDRVDWIHPNEIVNQACAIAHNHIRHRAKLVKELSACEPLPGDRNKLVQVVTNLLVNAAQALPEDANEARILVRTRIEEGRVVISVADTGTGIPRDVLGRIFEPFFTTKGTRDGTGLGLSLSLDIARQHDGTLEVETEVGVGTRFDLVLPLVNGLTVEPKPDAAKSQDILQRGRVLVVDDEPGILRSLGRLIGRNHEVETRGGGRSALDLLEADDAFDVILCDLMMPDVDGPMVHEVLSERAPHLARRMVFMSGGAFTPRAQLFLERVNPIILDKPAPASMLERAIQRVLAVPDETAELPSESLPNRGPPTRSFL